MNKKPFLYLLCISLFTVVLYAVTYKLYDIKTNDIIISYETSNSYFGKGYKTEIKVNATYRLLTTKWFTEYEIKKYVESNNIAFNDSIDEYSVISGLSKYIIECSNNRKYTVIDKAIDDMMNIVNPTYKGSDIKTNELKINNIDIKIIKL